MKKLLITTLTDGRVITKDITLEKIVGFDGRIIPFGAPANHEGYALACMQRAAGFIDPDPQNTNDIQCTWIGAGDIKKVRVKFENKINSDGI